MKLTALQQQNRRSNSFRGLTSSSPLDSSSSVVDGKSPAAVFWVVLHCLCCLISLVLGFRFSRLVFFLLFSNPTSISNPLVHTTLPANLDNKSTATPSTVPSRVVVGRHGILIRPWPHPNPAEVMKAHRILERVQKEQRAQYGVKNPKKIIAVTPTYVRTFQALHLTGVMHSLMNVPYDLVWVVVEAGGKTNETASLLLRSGLDTIHIGFDQKMPISWLDRHKLESQMRLRALRVIKEERLDGIVMFADDSNMHSMELFDEIQKVKWFGAVSVGIIAHSEDSEEGLLVMQKEEDNSSRLPIQGPACNSSNHFVGWHTFDSVPLVERSARYIGDRAVVLPRKLEWAGFALNSRLFWKDVEDKPQWVKDFDLVADDEDIESPLSLLKDHSVVEPLGSCGRKVMLWWLRVEARADSKFPAGWIIDPPLDVTVPAKRTPWPDAPPELPSHEKITTIINVQENTDQKRATTKSRSPRRRSSRSKRKRVARTIEEHVSSRGSGEN